MYTPGFEQVTFRYVMKLYTTTWTYRFNVSRMSHVKFVDLYQYQEFTDLYQAKTCKLVYLSKFYF